MVDTGGGGPTPLGAGTSFSPRNRSVVFHELGAKLREFGSVAEFGRYDRLEVHPSLLTLAAGIVLLGAELAALPLLRKAADSLDYVVRTYRSQPQEREAARTADDLSQARFSRLLRVKRETLREAPIKPPPPFRLNTPCVTTLPGSTVQQPEGTFMFKPAPASVDVTGVVPLSA